MSFAGFTRVACWVLNLNKNTGPTGIYWTTESALRQLCPGTSASPRGKCTTLRGKKISRSHWCPACWTASDTKALPYTILWACAEATHVKHNVMHTLFCTANITWEKKPWLAEMDRNISECRLPSSHFILTVLWTATSCSCMEGQCHYEQALEPKQQTNPQRKVRAKV